MYKTGKADHAISVSGRSPQKPQLYLLLFSKLGHALPYTQSSVSMAPLHGKLESQVELKSGAHKFFNIWKKDSHKMPAISSNKVGGVDLHEGDRESHGAIKSWSYTIGNCRELNNMSTRLKKKFEFIRELGINTWQLTLLGGNVPNTLVDPGENFIWYQSQGRA